MTETLEPLLKVCNLTLKSLKEESDRTFAIENLSFSIDQKEIVCIVGESGSGKSICAQAIMGICPKNSFAITNGKILFQDVDLLQLSAEDLRNYQGAKIAMIFQEPLTALDPLMKIGKQIAEVLEIHTTLHKKAIKQRVIEVLKDVHIEDTERIANSYPFELSGGQRQRVMIAMALALEPKLLLADEPTTALDVTTQAQILALINELRHRHNMAVMFITHDFGVVAEIADRVIVLKGGHIMEQGSAKAVLNEPKSPYTKILLKSVPTLKPPNRQDKSDQPIALFVKDLCYTYHGNWFDNKQPFPALKNITFHLHRGETLGLVGESGAGKTTVGRCVARLEDPSKGKIIIDNTDIAMLSQSALRPLRKDLQIIFQDPYRSLNPSRTVGQSIIEGLTNYGESKTEALNKAKNILEIVGLSENSLERYPHQFSGGQRQRICIARALALNPKILIADEAVSSLDVSVQANVLALLQNIQKEFNIGILFITHDLRVASQICDRIIVMQNGSMIEENTTKNIIENPQNPYTKKLWMAIPGAQKEFFHH